MKRKYSISVKDVTFCELSEKELKFAEYLLKSLDFDYVVKFDLKRFINGKQKYVI